jgi:hypothetical protein
VQCDLDGEIAKRWAHGQVVFETLANSNSGRNIRGSRFPPVSYKCYVQLDPEDIVTKSTWISPRGKFVKPLFVLSPISCIVIDFKKLETSFSLFSHLPYSTHSVR